MTRTFTPDAGLLRSLPLPLAQLYDEGCRAENPRDRHDHAYFLWELGLRLLAMVAVVEARASGLAAATEARLRSRLARPSVGHWWEIARGLYPALAAGDPGRFDALAGLLSGRDRLGGEPLVRLRSRLRDLLGRQVTTAPCGVRVDNLFDLLLTYRNRFMGHNLAVRRPPGLLREIGDDLLAGLTDLYHHLDPLSGGHLVHVGPARSLGLDARRLRGTEPTPLPLAEYSDGLLDAGRVYLATGSGPPRSLHPFLSYRPEDRTSWFFNARPSDRRAELICSTNGDYRVVAIDPDAGPVRPARHAALARVGPRSREKALA